MNTIKLSDNKFKFIKSLLALKSQKSFRIFNHYNVIIQNIFSDFDINMLRDEQIYSFKYEQKYSFMDKTKRSVNMIWLNSRDNNYYKTSITNVSTDILNQNMLETFKTRESENNIFNKIYVSIPDNVRSKYNHHFVCTFVEITNEVVNFDLTECSLAKRIDPDCMINNSTFNSEEFKLICDIKDDNIIDFIHLTEKNDIDYLGFCSTKNDANYVICQVNVYCVDSNKNTRLTLDDHEITYIKNYCCDLLYGSNILGQKLILDDDLTNYKTSHYHVIIKKDDYYKFIDLYETGSSYNQMKCDINVVQSKSSSNLWTILSDNYKNTLAKMYFVESK